MLQFISDLFDLIVGLFEVIFGVFDFFAYIVPGTIENWRFNLSWLLGLVVGVLFGRMLDWNATGWAVLIFFTVIGVLGGCIADYRYRRSRAQRSRSRQNRPRRTQPRRTGRD